MNNDIHISMENPVTMVAQSAGLCDGDLLQYDSWKPLNPDYIIEKINRKTNVLSLTLISILIKKGIITEEEFIESIEHIKTTLDTCYINDPEVIMQRLLAEGLTKCSKKLLEKLWRCKNARQDQRKIQRSFRQR